MSFLFCNPFHADPSSQFFVLFFTVPPADRDWLFLLLKKENNYETNSTSKRILHTETIWFTKHNTHQPAATTWNRKFSALCFFHIWNSKLFLCLIVVRIWDLPKFILFRLFQVDWRTNLKNQESGYNRREPWTWNLCKALSTASHVVDQNFLSLLFTASI